MTEALIEVGDVLRPASYRAVDRLRRLGVRPVLATGDREAPARAVATALASTTYTPAAPRGQDPARPRTTGRGLPGRRRRPLRHALSGGDRLGHLVPGFSDGRADQGVAGPAHRQVSQHLVSTSPHAFRDGRSGRCLVVHGATVWTERKPAGCGLRNGETRAVNINNLVAEDVYRVHEQVHSNAHRPAKLKHRKVGKFREVPLPRSVREAIERHEKKHGTTREGYLLRGRAGTTRSRWNAGASAHSSRSCPWWTGWGCTASGTSGGHPRNPPRPKDHSSWTSATRWTPHPYSHPRRCRSARPGRVRVRPPAY